MSRHRIDTKTCFAYEENGSEIREIEDPHVKTVAKENPPMRKVKPEPYWLDEKLMEAVKLAIALGRPLLLQGDPGCGKTRLAYSVAYTLRLPLEECYIKSTSRAQDLLYAYDAVNRLYDAQLGEKCPPDETGNPRSQNVGNYIHVGPLGRAIVRAQYGRRSVVLIDEIDKADLDFPNDLLLELDRLEFSIPETQEHYAVPDECPELRPIVFVTHNEEKALPTAFLRRCIFHYVEFPEKEEHLRKILALHEITDEALTENAIKVLLELRDLKPRKKPGLSELIDWTGYMQAVNAPVDKLAEIPYIGVLLKQRVDQQSARQRMKE